MFRKEYFSPLGTVLLISDKGRLVYCNWVDEDCESKLVSIESMLSKDFNEIDKNVVDLTINQLDDYFGGRINSFSVPKEFYGTSFQKKVWDCISEIPYGMTITYGALAIRVGNPKGIRAVARACGSNPIAIICGCHRVVGKGNNLGGYTGGISKKEWLLSHEKGNLSNKILQKA